MSDYTTILVDTPAPGVGLVRLDRPKALNALDEQLMHDVVAAVRTFDADPAVGAVVITGSERAFAAGADIAEMAGLTHDEVVRRDLFAGWDAITGLRTPLIAAVAGHALGGGCELAMLCDLLIAADTARFGQPEIKLGVIPGIGGSQRLTRAVGKAKAMDLCLTGRTMDVEEAERAGLVSRIVPADELVTHAVEVAATIAGMSRTAAAAAKEAVDVAFESSLAEGVRFERRTFHALFATSDQKEGMAAFLEKRTPDYGAR
ncbi:Enoyl-CoA hydratase [Pseudonocardia sp. Ae168_Ps1]|uniref:enoyl-CoA hydratase n=1 Tax=unclassified Pseudonocardia TaxID=2619320 RepID=UPI00094B6EA7|nr:MULTISPECIES: enoyl-CoA hydratase [unclassified Pseudonocardia]OLL74458.1 Enoyl-CoA hydratase [Pseudonocardia sp. Ae150A_Ps1]OLL80438.1 Enoyl-CoA hydratase [Pseudonocardia sp. Ae168_Ps1]OLL85435.1 Enoyl-CoA hydratase [Pseudonocardia sp. Ae263_Ps1]OLL94538.1 Enoyl-CoA hydratase [Pseudonocardia sp. Ae356_Ps1]